MTFPSARTTAFTANLAAATDPVVNLPGTLTAGDTMLMLFRKASGTQNAPTGWTEILNSTADASDDSTIIAWKKVVGDEGTTATMTNGSASAKFACVVWQFQDAADPSAIPPEMPAAVIGTDAAPDPPNHTPAAGAKDYLWIAAGGWEGEQTTPPTYPANYTLSQLAAGTGTGGVIATNCRVAGGCRQLNATAENPGAFTISVADDWTAATVVVHPVPPPPVTEFGLHGISVGRAGSQQGLSAIEQGWYP